MPLISEDTHELRDLRWRNRQLGKQLGKAGAKIHELRCQLAEVREINGKIGRNHVRDLERQVANDTETIVELRIELEKMVGRIAGLIDEKNALRLHKSTDTLSARA
jgi:hypothetical protein